MQEYQEHGTIDEVYYPEFSEIEKPEFWSEKTDDELKYELYTAKQEIYSFRKRYGIYQSLTDELIKNENQLSILEITWMLLRMTPAFIKLVYYLAKLISQLQGDKK